MAETVRKRERSSFYLAENTFDAVPIPAAFVSGIEAVPLQCRFELVRISDEKHGVVDIVFLLTLSKKYFGQCCRVRSEKTGIEEFVRIRIDNGVQPELPIVNMNHAFVQRNLIRSFTAVWLWISFLHSTIGGLSRTVDTQLIKNKDSTRK